MNLPELFMAHRTQRYHTNRHLARLGQNNAEHCHGVALILLAHCPADELDQDLLTAALLHDGGEGFAGDLSQPFKAANPNVAALHRAAEEDHLEELVGHSIKARLSQRQQKWLKLADGFEALLYAALNRPGLMDRDDWVAHAQAVGKIAIELGGQELADKLAMELDAVTEEGRW